MGFVLANDYHYGDIFKAKNEFEERLSNETAINKEELKKEELKNEQLIAKCNLIGKNLVKGKSMEDIKAKLTNFKLTPSKETQNKIKNIKNMTEAEKNEVIHAENANTGNDIKAKTANTGNDIKAKTGNEKDSKNENAQEGQENSLTVATKFDKFLQKHPKLKEVTDKHPKIKKGIDKVFDTVSNIFNRNKKDKHKKDEHIIENDKPIMDEVDSKDLTEDEKTKLENVLSKEDEMLLGITEKGEEQYKKDRRQQFAEKYKANKLEAANRYAESYGGHYYSQDGATVKPEEAKEDEGLEPGDD